MKSLKPHWCRASRMMRLSVIALCLPLILGERAAAETAKIDDDGTIHLPAVALPDSSLFHNEEREALKAERQKYKLADSATKCPSAAKVIEVGANRETIVGTLKCMEEEFYLSSEYRHLRELYPVTIVHSNIAGIPVEIFTPRNGIESANQQRVLINVHGGGFIAGARTSSKKESIPISSLGKIRVISIDYREAPDDVFPAASEDVATVYRELLKTYRPQNIGIYGCSAGGLLTAEALAWFQQEKLPTPGAAGMFCAGASYWTDGDTGILWGASSAGNIFDTASLNPYFKGTDINNPLAFPGRSPSIIAKYPPSLLVSGTRDFALSSVVHTQELLTSKGISADLHVWEGMGHAFFYDPDLPQSREMYSVVVKFFDTHLGK
jgi:monoterpene epsilon-lactone hydrolase